MISIEEANRISLMHTIPLPAVTVALAQSLGRVLAEDIAAQEPIPAGPTSIMDGYAVVAADGAGEFEIVGGSRAGDKSTPGVCSGNVCYITTGGCVPSGADAVVMVEDTLLLSPSRVRILKAVASGQNIRQPSSDMAVGDKVLSAGDVIGPAEIGLLATVGAIHPKVTPQVVVAIMSTGDELADASAPVGSLPAGTVRDSNRAMLIGACQEEGANVLDMGIVGDDEGALEKALDSAIARGAHVLVTSGGVSMGDKDLVKGLLEKRGTIHFGRVLMKPGKPLTFATLSLSGPNTSEHFSIRQHSSAYVSIRQHKAAPLRSPSPLSHLDVLTTCDRGV